MGTRWFFSSGIAASAIFALEASWQQGSEHMRDHLGSRNGAMGPTTHHRAETDAAGSNPITPLSTRPVFTVPPGTTSIRCLRVIYLKASASHLSSIHDGGRNEKEKEKGKDPVDSRSRAGSKRCVHALATCLHLGSPADISSRLFLFFLFVFSIYSARPREREGERCGGGECSVPMGILQDVR